MATPTMNTIKNLIEGWDETGTNSKHSPRFQDFVRKFRSAFTKELKAIGATDIQIGQGHYYISGFFTMGSQPYYFSVGDIRSNFTICGYETPMMYRTAEHYKDYTGGSNQFVAIETGMAKKMRLHC